MVLNAQNHKTNINMKITYHLDYHHVKMMNRQRMNGMPHMSTFNEMII